MSCYLLRCSAWKHLIDLLLPDGRNCDAFYSYSLITIWVQSYLTYWRIHEIYTRIFKRRLQIGEHLNLSEEGLTLLLSKMSASGIDKPRPVWNTEETDTLQQSLGVLSAVSELKFGTSWEI